MSIIGKIKKSIDIVSHPFNKGYCLICEKDTIFVEYKSWLRDYYQCIRCGSIPRHRAIVNTLNVFYPHWKTLTVHESSPSGPLYWYLRRVCDNYSASQFFSDILRGHFKDGFRSEDLTSLTLEDSSVDLLITSDVFEHVMEPARAFGEIARVLKKGGAHIFTMPWYPELKTTRQRARMNNGEVQFIEEPIYHGNPIDRKKGSLVTFDWGLDFMDYIFEHSGLQTTVYLVKDRKLGLDAEFLEVFISRKV